MQPDAESLSVVYWLDQKASGPIKQRAPLYLNVDERRRAGRSDLFTNWALTLNWAHSEDAYLREEQWRLT